MGLITKILSSFSTLVTSIFGVIFLLIIIVLWLGFFGIIPHGDPPDDGYGGRYTPEMMDSFR